MEEKDFIHKYTEMIYNHYKNHKHNEMSNFSKGEGGVLVYIYRKNNVVTPGELGEFFGVCSGRIGNVLKDLESKKCIVRISDAQDKRKTNVSLTEKGIEIAKNITHRYVSKIGGIYKILGKNDAEELIRIMNKINDRKGGNDV